MEKNDKNFLQKLEERFEANMHRHKNIKWDFVQSLLVSNKNLYDRILKMEETGGELDLVDLEVFGGLVYVDMAKESPKDRRILCYDKRAREKKEKIHHFHQLMKKLRKLG